MTIAYRNEEVQRMVDPDTGMVDRRMFTDQDIYEIELERIFARAWNFMAHDSQIPNPGDFFMTYIGENRVIVVRDNDGNPQVLVNTCRHRGNAVCRAEEGHATSFMCTYHGWTYDLKGDLVGVPGFKEVYHEELDRENWGLIKAGQVDTYKGFIFANMDPEAVGLEEYLGETGQIGLSLLAERGSDMTVVPGVQKYTIQCNWKLAVDNLFDWYHVDVSHGSAIMSGMMGPPKPGGGSPNPLDQTQFVALGNYGHAISGPLSYIPPSGETLEVPGLDESWRERPEARQSLPPAIIQTMAHPNIFPNLWVAHNVSQLSQRHPKGPGTTEIWWFTFLDKSQPEPSYHMKRWLANHAFGPAGLLEQDDGENWGESTKGAKGTISSRFPLNFSMGRTHGEIIDDEAGPLRIETHVNEHAQLWTYRSWVDWMAAESWADLKANHTPAPTDRV